MHQRREQPRLKFSAVVRDRENKRQGTTKNLSVDGCFIKRDEGFTELLPIGTRIDLLIILPNSERSIAVSGVVKHHGLHEEGMGISFEKIDANSVAIIQEFINTFLEDPSDEWAVIKEAYWKEVDRLKAKTPHGSD